MTVGRFDSISESGRAAGPAAGFSPDTDGAGLCSTVKELGGTPKAIAVSRVNSETAMICRVLRRIATAGRPSHGPT
jgi:hypothetical protein